MFNTGADTAKGQALAATRAPCSASTSRSRRTRSCRSRAGELSDDPDELLRTATALGGRYMGDDRADEFGRRNGVPGELVVRLHPTKVVAALDMTA